MSYGCPVLVGKNVGAKDLIKDGITGWIVDFNEEAFCKSLIQILKAPKLIEQMNKNIRADLEIINIEKHSIEIMNLIYE